MHRYDCKTCCYYDRLTGLCGVCMKKILKELKVAQEKAVAAFNLEDVCVIECYAPAEIAKIIALKEAVKANKVISFLSGQHEKTEQE